MRLARYIAQCGVCSRRNASRLIESQRVIVNGEVADHLTFIRGGEQVLLDGERIDVSRHAYYLYHKPVGIDCNLDVMDPASLIHHLPIADGRLFPVGRLDKDSCGLLLLTNNGELTNQLLAPEFKKPKCYVVSVKVSYENQQRGRLRLDESFIKGMNQPIIIKGRETLPCEIVLLSDLCFEITLTQGLNRQIRRMCANQGFNVIALKRISFAGLQLGELTQGQYRELTLEEVLAFN